MSGRGRLVNFHVPVEVEFEYERFGADEADVRSTAVVNHQMLGEVALLEESFSTLGADVASFARMPQFVFSQQLPGSEFFFTLETLVRRSSLVHTLMSDQFSFYTVSSVAFVTDVRLFFHCQAFNSVSRFTVDAVVLQHNIVTGGQIDNIRQGIFHRLC
ncbi:hypothetical protein T12_897 [Trichinella patagoniensis]|uniref:Uncharacterized protein n=1 Tax=Trichinella patagoniensis TaxID=990121 RepID=A0A0V0ZQX3_9BILA|nr:hypothetical protein T12_897 [Trichinella patagoniensis]